MSIYRRALGSDFGRLHPQMQKRFGFSSRDQVACVGAGIMDKIWHGPLYTLPFLYIGTWRRIMFPQSGQNVPFTIENYAYLDRFNRETVTWVRTFELGKPRRFDATMIYSEKRGKIVDYLGSHQHLAVDIDLTVTERGGIKLRSGEQRFYEGIIGFRFPMIFSGLADVEEWFDDVIGKFRIRVEVHNRAWGPLFGYEGAFDAHWIECSPDGVPAHVKPLREEQRD